jgi:O-antigen ligase
MNRLLDTLRPLAARPWDSSHVLALAALVGPGLGMLAPLGLAPLLIAAALGVLALEWRDRVWRAFPRAIAAILALICCWAALSALWAVDPPRSVFAAAQLTLNTLGGVVLVGAALRLRSRRGAARRIGVALVAGVALAVGIFAVGLVTGPRLKLLWQALGDGQFVVYRFAIQVFNRGVTITALAALPAVMFLWLGGRRRAAGTGGILLAAMMLISKALAAKLLLVIDLAAPLLFRGSGRRAGLVLGALLAAMVAAIPLAAVNLPPPQVSADWAFLPYSSHHRLTIWEFVAERIAERPILGWGMDSSRAIPGAEDERIVFLEIPRGSGNRVRVPEQNLPLHPHNAVLQWWLELGAVGALLFAALLIRLTGSALAATGGTAPRICVGALLLGGCAISTVSFGFWQSWWQCTLWFLAAWAAALAPVYLQGESRS